MRTTLIIFLISGIYSQFGQNIVQYDEFDWYYIQSPHFDIYYYQPGEEHAEYVANEAEMAFDIISAHFDWKLTKRYAIIIYNSHNDFQQTNVVDSYMYEGIGGVTELYKTRVVIPFDGSRKEFKHVIHHELVHMFINDYMYGGSIQNMISNQISYAIPLWMNEGLAEFIADSWGTNSDMWVRDLVLNGENLPDLNQLNGYLAYRGGQSVWKFITSKWGIESISEILYQIKKKKSVNGGVRAALGIKLTELNEQWHEYIKKFYYPEIILRSMPNEFSRQLTDHKKLENSYNIAPALSPDGSKIAMYSNKSGNMALYLISTENGEFIKKIIQGERNAEYEELHILKPGVTWSPSGQEIAFAAKSGKSDALFIYNIKKNKSEKFRLGLEGIFRPSWSPLGDEIAFIGNNGEKSDIYIYDIKEKKLINLTDDWYSEDHVSWAPDGMKLLFISDRDNNINSSSPENPNQYQLLQDDIYAISRVSRNISRLTDSPWNEAYPILTSGKNLAFVSDKSGVNNIYIKNENLEESVPITNIMTGISQLNWNADYSQLSFTAFWESGYDIFLMINPLDRIGMINDIPIAVWKTENLDQELLFKPDRERIHDGKDEYKNYVFHRNHMNSENKNEPVVELATSTTLDSSGNYIPHRYRTRFSLDLAQGYASYNTMYAPKAMASIIWSDILGDHKVYLGTQMQITSLNNSDYYLYYRFLPLKIDYNFLFYHTAIPYNVCNNCNSIDGIPFLNADGTMYQYAGSWLRQTTINGLASRPISRFQRLDFGLNYGYVEQVSTAIVGENSYGYEVREFSDTSLATIIPSLSYIWDNTMWDFIFPNRGARLNATIKISPKVFKTGLQFQTLTLDYRKYYPLKNGISLGGRIFMGRSFGINAQKFKMGGLPWLWSSYGGDYYYFDHEYDLKEIYFSEYVMPLRGVQVSQKFGKSALLLNAELRFPLLIYYFPAIKFLGQISAVLFTDFGLTWDDQFPNWNNYSWNDIAPEGFLWTYGFGPRFIFLGMPWKLEYAWQVNPFKKTQPQRTWFLSTGLDF